MLTWAHRSSGHHQQMPEKSAETSPRPGAKSHSSGCGKYNVLVRNLIVEIFQAISRGRPAICLDLLQLVLCRTLPL